MYQQHQGVAYAITLRNTGELLGAVSLPRIEGVRNIRLLGWRATLGKGYAFEASKVLLEFARMHFELNGITVMHLVDNQRSKSVIQN